MPDARITALDGMRGLAAFAVLGVHSTHGAFPQNGGLAVDLFFILSGFVLAMVYEDRLAGGMTSRAFLLARLARLYPLYIFGAAVGLALNVSGSGWDAVWSFAHAAVFLPYVGKGVHAGSFWLDGPLWSLSFEMLVNVLFGLGLWRLPSRVMALLVAACAGALVVMTVTTGTLNYGWQSTATPYLLGFARVGFGFPLGWLIWRYRAALRGLVDVPGASGMMLAMVAITFCLPSGPCELFAVLLVYPLAVTTLALGRQPRGRLAQVAVALGALSYPLYVTHALVLEVLWSHFGAAADWLGWLVAPVVAWLAHKTVEPMGRGLLLRVVAGTAPRVLTGGADSSRASA